MWEETSASEVMTILERGAHQAKADQEVPVFQAWLLARNPYVGGMKELDADDLYSGLARRAVSVEPYSPRVMRGLRLANELHSWTKRLYLSQAHVDLLDGRALAKWFKRKGG